jgi:hypothetical protein
LVYGHRAPGSPHALGRWRRDPAWCITTLSGTGRDDDGRRLGGGLEPTGPADGPTRDLPERNGMQASSPEAASSFEPEQLRLAVAARWLSSRGVPTVRRGYLGRVLDLESGTERWYELGDTEMAAAASIIRSDVDRQRGFFVNGDATRPRSLEAFAPTTDATVCASCPFRMLCDEAGVSAAREASAAQRSPDREAAL